MHRTRRATVRIAAGDIIPGSSRSRCEPDVESANEDAFWVFRIDSDRLVVPILWIIPCAPAAVSERAALRTLHIGPARAAIDASPGADLATVGIAAAPVVIWRN